jgi:hypothetical protein
MSENQNERKNKADLKFRHTQIQQHYNLEA